MSHLKTLAAPGTWHLQRKQRKYIVKPKPSGTSMDLVLPIRTIIIDKLGAAKNNRELKKIIANVKINGKTQKHTKSSMGIFDVLEINHISYRMIFDGNGRLTLTESKENIKPSKVTGKKKVNGGKTQLLLHDGRTLLSEEKVRVGDTLIMSIPDFKIKKVVACTPGAHIYLMRGKHRGSQGQLIQISGHKAVYEQNGEKIETLKEYIIATEKPLI